MKIPVLDRDSTSSVLLDLLRGLSALFVMVYHLRSFTLTDYVNVQHKNIVLEVIYMFSSRGTQFVMMFFVLSGYFVGSTVLRSILSGKWSWQKYLIDRISRLWIVLIPALLLTWVWDGLSLHLFHEGYGGGHWVGLLANTFFLQAIWVPTYGGNGPLWSLSYEFWYYMLFPTVVLAIMSKSVRKKTLYLLLAVCIALFMRGTVLEYFGIWVLGVLVAVLPHSKLRPRVQLAGFVLAGFLAFASMFNDIMTAHGLYTETFLSDLIVALCCAVFIYLAKSFLSASNRYWKRGALSISGMSYTLYLTHFPLLNFLQSAMHHSKLQPTIKNLALVLLVGMVIYLYSWLLSRVTEKHTASVRSYLLNIIINGNQYRSIKSQKHYLVSRKVD